MQKTTVGWYFGGKKIFKRNRDNKEERGKKVGREDENRETRPINDREKDLGRINSISVLYQLFFRMCTVGMDIYKIILYDYEANIAAGKKPEHCNTGDEEDISPTFFCLGKRRNMPKNFLLL